MRRQLGADRVELDGDLGYARYWLGAPRQLDFGAMMDAALDAGYTITSIQMVLDGTLSNTDCAECDTQVTTLTIPETGQRFELIGEHAAGITLYGSLEVLDWAGAHPQLRLKP